MSGASKMTGRRLSSQKALDKNLADITLDDYANSSISSGKRRMKKAATSSVVREMKQLCLHTDNRAWYEKLEEFEGDVEVVEDEEEEGGKSLVFRKHRRKKKNSECKQVADGEGLEYPLDIWFLLSDYIRPQDVKTFAGICKCSFQVVNSAKFWFGLYKRYYKSVPNIPERLQPECMVRLYGLRACVIRALYYMYSPFINKLKAITTFEGDPHCLTKRQCILMWHQKCKNGQWLFYFKMKKCDLCCGRGSSCSQQPDLLEMLEDVWANQEDGCRVLQVTCLNFISVPMVLGLTLSSVTLNVSQGMRYHRLHLVFSPAHLLGKPQSHLHQGSTIVILDPIINLRILDWWHPMYPHSSGRSQFNDASD